VCIIAPQHSMATPDTVAAKVWVLGHQRRPQWRPCVQTGSPILFELDLAQVFFKIFVARQAEADPQGGLAEGGGAGVCPGDPNSVQGAGGRGTATEEPPRWAPVGSSAVISAAHEPGRMGGRLWGGGAAFWCPKWPVPLSRLFGGGVESHRNPLKSVGTASGWCGVGHRHIPAKCARGYPRKRPGSTPNQESGSEIGIVKASWCCRRRSQLH
jgi:hypothetical protein